MKHKIIVALIAFFTFSNSLHAQIITAEDSLTAGLVAGTAKTIISGYGEANASHDFKLNNSNATLKRTVLFIGHKFSNKITLFTEMELENAVVTNEAGNKGELSMEQALLKFDINKSNYILAGLFIPRIGIINENHLPITFNGVERPMVEQLVIPATWRSIGIGYYGNSERIRGLHYSVSLAKGLDASKFTNGSGIREGRQMGNVSNGNSVGINGSLLYYVDNFRIQYSTYMGGTTAIEQRVADSILIKSKSFSNPVFLNEFNVQYRNNGVEAKALAAYISIPNALEINRAYANNTPNAVLGAYAEIGYNILTKTKYNKHSFVPFVRYEYMDLNSSIASNGVENDANKKSFLIAGITYKPLQGVAIKMDYTLQQTGVQNSALIVTPFPQQVPYYTKKNFLNLGIAYSF